MEDRHQYYLDVEKVKEFLPHRAPLFLIDRILEIHSKGNITTFDFENEIGTRVVAQKAITYNEPVFQGHFPGLSIYPGVYLLEAMAQATFFSFYPTVSELFQKGKIPSIGGNFQCMLSGIEGARFKRPIVPGDLLRIETQVIKNRGPLWVFDGSVFVEGEKKKVCSAEILAHMMPTPQWVDAAGAGAQEKK